MCLGLLSSARRCRQPQLNKAAKSSELHSKGDRNPKDRAGLTRVEGGRGAYSCKTCTCIRMYVRCIQNAFI